MERAGLGLECAEHRHEQQDQAEREQRRARHAEDEEAPDAL